MSVTKHLLTNSQGYNSSDILEKKIHKKLLRCLFLMYIEEKLPESKQHSKWKISDVRYRRCRPPPDDKSSFWSLLGGTWSGHVPISKPLIKHYTFLFILMLRRMSSYFSHLECLAFFWKFAYSLPFSWLPILKILWYKVRVWNKLR